MNEKRDSLDSCDSQVELRRISYIGDDTSKNLEIKTDNESNENKNDDSDQNKWLKSKRLIIKNLIILGLAWMFQFTAYQSMANLQSSLNEGIGTVSLSSIYVALILSCLFAPSFLIKNIGLKWTIFSSQICYLLYIIANMYPKWFILIPAGIILGIGAAPLWTAKCTYLTEISSYYAKLTGSDTKTVVNRFFGIFFAMFQTTQIWGNVISSSILKSNPSVNETINESRIKPFCGANDCPGTNKTAKIVKPLVTTVYTLCGIYIGFTIIGVMLIGIFLNTYKRKDEPDENNKDGKISKRGQFRLVVSTVKHIKKRKQLLIIPLNLWLGFSQAYMGADFARSFVNCLKGVNFVGYVFICYGAADVLGSYFFGHFSKYIGRPPCFIIPGLLNYAMIFLMLFWVPNEDELYVLFIIAVCWGIADSGWQTQINSLYGALFEETKEAAYSNFRLWEAVGFATAYAYSSHLCVYVKLYLLIVYLTLGLTGYIIIEILQRRKDKVVNKEKKKLKVLMTFKITRVRMRIKIQALVEKVQMKIFKTKVVTQKVMGHLV